MLKLIMRYSIFIIIYLYTVQTFAFEVNLSRQLLIVQASEIENREKIKKCNKELDKCQAECLRIYPLRRDFRQGKCRDYCILDYKDKCDVPVYIKSTRI